MPYPESLVQPMRAELTRLGFDEMKTVDEVDEAFDQSQEGTLLLVVNSVCGCAAANARPAAALAMNADHQPDRYVTVFAGQDTEATAHVRSTYLPGIPPSSPFMALFKDGEPVYVIERRHIEGRSASAIASDLVGAYAKFCSKDVATKREQAPQHPSEASDGEREVPSTFRSIM